ncbi:MAG TPA: hypothetical protein VN325_23195 [Steroidobacteraceae bacterium]|nr:hypothetical protein [Steroidobacteraceae bacterium]
MCENLKVEWVDGFREPQCKPNPEYPNGIDIDWCKRDGVPTCHTALPYPAKRCGYYLVKCNICDTKVAITTAGRPDDPRSVDIPCVLKGSKQ